MNLEEHLACMLRNSPVVVFVLKPDWTPIYLSTNVETVFGYPVALFTKDLQFCKTLVHTDDQERVLRIPEALAASDKIEVESRILRQDGEYIHTRSEIKLVRNEHGTPERIVGFLLDRTKDVQQSLERERQKQQLEDANEAMEQFVYIASHDLREPLIGVAGYATLLMKRYTDRLDEQGRHFLDEVVRGCKAMEQKIDDLLELSRAGRETPSGSFALGSAVDQARRSLVGPIEKNAATICYDSLPVVSGDRGQIAQVFQNLFSNSIKYRSKDVPPVVEVTAETYAENPRFFCITVKDNGIGFDMRHADRIFGVFQRLYTIDQYPGTGIGLAIVKKIIERHGGNIRVQSKPGYGTTFYFTLAKPDL